MNFGINSLGHFRITSHQTLDFHFTIVKQAFLSIFKLEGLITLKLLNIFLPKFLDKHSILLSIKIVKMAGFPAHLRSFLML